MSPPNDSGKIVDGVSLGNTIFLLNQLIPQVAWLVSLLEKGNGYLKLPSPHVELLSAEGIEPWAAFYESCDSIKSLSLPLIFGNQKALDLIRELQHSTLEQILLIREKLKQDMVDDCTDDLSSAFGPSKEDINLLWENISAGHYSDTLIETYKSYLLPMHIFLAIGHNCLSLMRFGVSLFNLVRQAQAGNDKSFIKAITVDKTILTSLDCFQSRLKRAHLSGDVKFLDDVSKAIRAPIIGAKIQYSNLMIAFAMLEDEGILGMPLKQLMYVCESVGVYGQDCEAQSDESLRQCRKRYRDKAVAKSDI